MGYILALATVVATLLTAGGPHSLQSRQENPHLQRQKRLARQKQLESTLMK